MFTNENLKYVTNKYVNISSLSLPQCLTLTFSPSLAHPDVLHTYTRTQVVNILNTRVSTHTHTHTHTHTRARARARARAHTHTRKSFLLSFFLRVVILKLAFFSSFLYLGLISEHLQSTSFHKKSDQLFNESVDRSTNKYTELPHDGGNIR